MHTVFWLESQKRRDNSEDLRIDERIILEWILGKQDRKVWIERTWLRIGTNGERELQMVQLSATRCSYISISMSQSSEFCRHNTLCCFSTRASCCCCCCCLFRYRLSPDTPSCVCVCVSSMSDRHADVMKAFKVLKPISCSIC
jgi:hypothetical protein